MEETRTQGCTWCGPEDKEEANLSSAGPSQLLHSSVLESASYLRLFSGCGARVLAWFSRAAVQASLLPSFSPTVCALEFLILPD